MESRNRLYLLIALIATAFSVHARVFMTQPQALARAFSTGVKAVRQTVFLTPEQIASAKKASGVDFKDRMIVRYTGSNAAGVVVGYAYFDTHIVRTLPETIMIVLTADGRVRKIEILSFDEPPDYLASERWIAQLGNRKLDDEFSLKRSIRPLSGASLTARVIVNASRKVLALHQVIGSK